MYQLLIPPCAFKRTGDFADDFRGLAEFDRFLLFQNLLHGLAADILHGEIEDSVFFADGVSLHNVRMADPAGGTRLPEERFDILLVVQELRLQNLQGDRPVQRKLSGEINFPHAAFADLLFNQKITDNRAGGGRRFRKINLFLAERTGNLISLLRFFRLKHLLAFLAVNLHHHTISLTFSMYEPHKL